MGMSTHTHLEIYLIKKFTDLYTGKNNIMVNEMEEDRNK